MSPLTPSERPDTVGAVSGAGSCVPRLLGATETISREAGTMSEQPTCAERIRGQAESRAGDFAQLFAVAAGESTRYEGEEMTSDDAYDRLAEFPLAVTLQRV